MSQKTGVYIDTGYGIGEALDIEALSKVATKEFKAAVCRADSYWTDPEKLAIIRNDIANEQLTSVLIAGPSPRVYQKEFTFDGVITERVNLREHVVWCHPANDEDTQMLAEDYMRMFMTKIGKYEDRPAFLEAQEKGILVIGGGFTGLTAALEAAKAGYKVYLVEKENQLGGWATKYSKVFTGKPPYDQLVDSPVKEKIDAVQSNQDIKVFLGQRVFSIAGAPGMFEVIIRPDGPWNENLVKTQNEWLAAKRAKEGTGEEPEAAKTSEEEVAQAEVFVDEVDFAHEKVTVGAVVLAAGWRPEKPTAMEHLGYGKYPDVITSVQLEELAIGGQIKRPSDGKVVESIAFLECIGDDIVHPWLYSSAVGCLVALKQAHYLRKSNPDGRAYIFYDNMRAPGQYEKFYRTLQDDPGVFMSKGIAVAVENGSSS